MQPKPELKYICDPHWSNRAYADYRSWYGYRLNSPEDIASAYADIRVVIQFLATGFVSTNGALPWSCAFSDISVDECQAVADTLDRISGKSESWYLRDGADPCQVKEYTVRRLISFEKTFKNAIRKKREGFGLYDFQLQAMSASALDLEFLCGLKYIDVGSSESRDYTCPKEACERLMRIHESGCWEDEIGIDPAGIADSTALRGGMDDFIDFLIRLCNEAQLYAEYCREFAAAEDILAVRSFPWDEASINELLDKSWAAKAFCMWKAGKMDFGKMFARRRSIFGLDGPCPV